MAVRDQLRLVRAAAIAEANRQRTAAAIPRPGDQPQAIAAFLKVADGISQALAADDLGKANQCFTNLPGVLSSLQKELGAAHRWSGLIQRLVALKWSLAKDLAEARKQFLPFSTVMVELTKQLKKEDPAFADLKIYHCPMAPKPGLWIQAQGPLRNPFFGSEMLECGREVKP
jgi:Cu(I)/Ag(I) efflux system membrane fusion protein